MELRILGDVEVAGDAGPVRLPALQRRLLARLTVEAGGIVSLDVLQEVLWGRRQPRSARKLLQVYVSQLRKVLVAPVAIRTEAAGYRLELPHERLDAARFANLVDEARAARAEGNVVLAASLLRRALGLWRGPAYGELAYEDFARREAERLEELRLVAIEERLDAELELGARTELLPELQSLSSGQPLRERLQSLLMRALYASGRQSDALDVYLRTRARLREELGLEPGVELRLLQRRILEHDPELAAVPASPAAFVSLPAGLDPLLGRQRELAELQALLVGSRVRFVVLVGAGGSGKTRLAIEAARQAGESFANGVVFVDLAPLRDPALVPQTIAAACGFELPPQGAPGTLAAALGPRELLLVLDNAEHLQAAGAVYAELLKAAPRLALLVTSRVVLHLSGEHVYPVEPLEQAPAATLFRARAEAVGARFVGSEDEDAAVVRLCERLDRLPLAIELAAPRVRLLPPAELLARLDPALPLLAGGVRDSPARQQTLRATLDWSYRLLTDREQVAFRRLGVFVGGFPLEAADQVCGADLSTLEALLGQSLLRQSAVGRLSLLETVREYALERLEEAGEAERVHRRHAGWCLQLALSANLSEEAEGKQLLGPVATELDNIRAALAWCGRSGEAALGLQLAVALEYFWIIRSPVEGVEAFEALLAHADGLSPHARARTLRAYGSALDQRGDFARAERVYEESLQAFETLGDERGVADLLYCLAFRLCERGEIDEARARALRSLELCRRLGRRKGEALALGALGVIECDAGDPDEGIALLEQSATIAGEVGFTWWQAHRLGELGEQAVKLRRYAEAEAWLRSSVAMLGEIGDRQNVLICLALLARAAAETGRLYDAGVIWGAIEAEERRAPVYAWHLAPEHGRLRALWADPVLRHAGPAFAVGRDEGRLLTFEAAIASALTVRQEPALPEPATALYRD